MKMCTAEISKSSWWQRSFIGQSISCSLRYTIELAGVISNQIGAAEKYSNCTTAFTSFSGKKTQSCRGSRVKYCLKKQLISAKHSEKI
jgi:hypothetical protein